MSDSPIDMARDLAALCIRTGRLALVYNGSLVVRREGLPEFKLSTLAPVLIWRQSWKKDGTRIVVVNPEDGLKMIRAALTAEVMAEQQRAQVVVNDGPNRVPMPDPLPPGIEGEPIEAWSDGRQIVILGEPPDEPDNATDEWYETSHNCDAMGCSTFGLHVLWRGRAKGVV